MEDKIEVEVGEYVRLDRNQGINKIVDITWDGLYESDEIIGDEWGNETYIIGNEDIVKHSKNIIDLIEVGDYVNGYKVINVIKGENAPSGKCVDIDSAMDSSLCTFWEEDIKSIVTKEQFKSMEYKVEEAKDE